MTREELMEDAQSTAVIAARQRYRLDAVVKTTLRLLLRWTLTHNKNFYSMRKTKMDLREQIEVAQRSRFQKCLVCTCAQSYQCQPSTGR
jgi:uncharacterized NAD(P)/FAD-binding protein YdhS